MSVFQDRLQKQTDDDEICLIVRAPKYRKVSAQIQFEWKLNNLKRTIIVALEFQNSDSWIWAMGRWDSNQF